MQANPGGQLAPEEVIGRDELIARLWGILERRHLYIVGERRMGKTSIIRDKMANSPPAGVRFVYMDVSRATSPLEFVERLQEVCGKHLDWTKHMSSRFQLLLGRLAGGETGASAFSIRIPSGLAANWKALLETLLDDLATLEGRTVIAFDELPLMLDAIKRNKTVGGEAVVIEILDVLRAVRQTESDLRMIYTGSLGLHHVLTGLREQGYQNDPTNDMQTIPVEPLAPKEAVELARRLLAGHSIICEDQETSAIHLATQTDGMPFYIQHIVDSLVTNSDNGDPMTIDRLLTERITDLRDLWHLRYYDERIGTHYPLSLRKVARAILDQLAATQVPLTFDEIYAALDPLATDRQEEAVRQTIHLLGLDNYLDKISDGYRFRHPFIARVWRGIRN